MDRLSADELVDDYADEIKTWRAGGWGRGRCVDAIEELTGRRCSHRMMTAAFSRLELGTTAAVKMDIEPVEMPEEPIEELVERRSKAARRKRQKFKHHQRKVTLPARPVGFLFVGDPHVDDEGCDWDLLMTDLGHVRHREGILGVCVGDVTNGWVGSLARLWAESGVTAEDAVRLSEYFLSLIQWLLVIGGNHDKWSTRNGFNPLEFFCKKNGVSLYADDQMRVVVDWKDRPELEPFEMVVRHFFKGNSQYHVTHAAHKEALFDGKAHLFVAGHIHSWGRLQTEQRHGRVTEAVSVRGYKFADEYAMTLGYPEQHEGRSCLVTVDPFDRTPDRVKLHWNIARGVQYLDMLRGV